MELKFTINQLVIPALKVSKIRDEYYAILIPAAFNEYVVDKTFIVYLKTKSMVIPLGPKKVSRLNNKNYCIFLPKNFNATWQSLHERKENVDAIFLSNPE